MESLTYRTAGVWGGGLGSDLSGEQVDDNFFALFSAVTALEDHEDINAGIDFINQPSGGNLFYIHLTNHAVLGPFVIPTSQWNPRGEWTPLTAYAPFDVVSNDGSLYIVTTAVTSAATFNAFATNGMDQFIYVLLLAPPADGLPFDGLPGQRLVFQTESPFAAAWEYEDIRLAIFVEGQPNPSETLLQYAVVDHMTFPVGLTGSSFAAGTPTASDVQYTINKNGSAIGSVNFNGPSPENVDVTFGSAISFVPGDVISLVAPATPDTVQSNISFTLVAQLTD